MLSKTLNFTKRFARDQDGNTAAIFTVALVGILGAAGFALDTSNVHRIETKMQSVTDAASLAVAKAQLSSDADMRALAQSFFDARPDLQPVTVERVERNGDQYSIVAVRPTSTYLMHLFGNDNVNIRTSSQTTYRVREFSLALVLDTTGSMRGNKITSLKSAAGSLVTELETASTNNVRISVVPFSQYVNVGMSNRNASWMDVPNDSVTTGPQVCRMKRDVVSRTNCRTVNTTCTDDGVSRACQRQVCDVTYGAPYNNCSTPTNRQKWYGCAGSRTAPYHLRAGYGGRKIPGAMNVRCGSEMLPLTTNLGSVKTKINSLTASGRTYLPSGISWGWRTLNSQVPFTQTAGDGAAAEKYMVIMTDGANTKSKNGTLHTGNDLNDANDVTRQLCASAKADGIQIYTIAYDVTDTATRALMAQCATAPDMYFDATNSAQLNDAFTAIGASLLDLRLTN